MTTDPFIFGDNPLTSLKKWNPKESFQTLENLHVEKKIDTIFALISACMTQIHKTASKGRALSWLTGLAILLSAVAFSGYGTGNAAQQRPAQTEISVSGYATGKRTVSFNKFRAGPTQLAFLPGNLPLNVPASLLHDGRLIAVQFFSIAKRSMSWQLPHKGIPYTPRNTVDRVASFARG